ncbi:hypothetical protein HKX48_006231 [Thoreauomyces humboldtii]|nr:hypothetical protein HKX48_006231 [Thoreauomyces humboldtii]
MSEATRTDLDIVLLDSLPYIDRSQPEGSSIADELIQAELAASGSNAPRAADDDLDLFSSHPLLIQDLQRIADPERPLSLDVSRLRLDPPSKESQSSLEAWRSADENAQAQLEHQTNRLINLELVNTFGSNAWKLHCFQLEWMAKAIEKEVEGSKKELGELNKERKLQQMKVGQTLQQLTHRYSELLQQTIRVDVATQALEAEVESLHAQKEALMQMDA